MADTFADWCSLTAATHGVEIELADAADPGIREVLAYQKSEANQEFSKFVRRNYRDWINRRTDDTPVMSHTLMRSEDPPRGRAARQDHAAADRQLPLRPVAGHIIRSCAATTTWPPTSSTAPSCPTATQYARNAVFAGLMPLAISRLMPDLWLNATTRRAARTSTERVPAAAARTVRARALEVDVRQAHTRPEQAGASWTTSAASPTPTLGDRSILLDILRTPAPRPT